MKLSEVRAAMAKHVAEVEAGPMLGEEFSDYSQRIWDSKLRIPFDDLPASLQKAVRELYPPAVFRSFLIECYTTPEFEKIVKTMPAQDAAKLPEPPETYISFQTMVDGIEETALEGLLIRARNTAIYTLEGKRATIDLDRQVVIYSDTKEEENEDIKPALYGNYACEAFETVLRNYKDAIALAVKKSTDGNGPAESLFPAVIQPTDIAFPKDNVTRKIFTNAIPRGQKGRVISGDEITIKDESGKKTKVPIAPIVTLSLLDLPPGVQITRDMTPIDNIVHGRICSLLEAGNTQFTGQAIYAAMTGNPAADATTDWLSVIDESWTRLTTTQVEIDTGTMGNAYNFKRWQRQRPIVQGGRDIITLGNQYGQTTVTIYSIQEEPILHSYAKALNQINRYPRILQNTPVNKTPEILVLQNQLLDHINAIPQISNHIRYDTLWDIIDVQAKTPAALRKKKAVLRGYIHKMLNYWKETGFISGWKEEKKGNIVHSIVIAKPKRNEALPPAQQSK